MTEPLTRSRLLLALVISLLLHVLLAGGLHGFDHVSTPDRRPLIQAALITPLAPPSQTLPPPAPKAEPAPPKPRPKKPRPVAQPQPEPTPSATDGPLPSTAGHENHAVAEDIHDELPGDGERVDRAIDEDAQPGSDAPTALTPKLALVSEARLEFDVFRGDLNIGETRYHWVHDGNRYQMNMLTETTGLAGLLRPLKIEQISTGDMTDTGFKPLHYVSQVRQGKAVDEEVVFDWSSNQVMLRAGTKRSEHALSAGAQDIISLWLEIIWRAQSSGDFDFTVATGKRYAPRWFIPEQDVASLDTTIGRLLVKRLEARAQPGESQIEIWLAPNLRWLPVRIRYTDRKGDAYDQRVRLIQYENLDLRAGGAHAAPGTLPSSDGPTAPASRNEPADEPANPYLR